MSKILQKNETGFGILIEEDSGYITKDLNTTLINEDYTYDISKPILINCILQKYGVKNRNGRIYPKDVLVSQVNEFQKKVDENSAVNQADHPDTSNVSLHDISHLIKKMWWGTGEDKHVLYGQLQLIVSPGYIKHGVCSVIGDKILLYLQNNIKIGISSRGVGSLKEIAGENIVQNDFELICFDLVSTPSTPGAYLFPKKEDINISEDIEVSIVNKLNESDLTLLKSLDKFLL